MAAAPSAGFDLASTRYAHGASLGRASTASLARMQETDAMSRDGASVPLSPDVSDDDIEPLRHAIALTFAEAGINARDVESIGAVAGPVETEGGTLTPEPAISSALPESALQARDDRLTAFIVLMASAFELCVKLRAAANAQLAQTANIAQQAYAARAIQQRNEAASALGGAIGQGLILFAGAACAMGAVLKATRFELKLATREGDLQSRLGSRRADACREACPDSPAEIVPLTHTPAAQAEGAAARRMSMQRNHGDVRQARASDRRGEGELATESATGSTSESTPGTHTVPRNERASDERVSTARAVDADSDASRAPEASGSATRTSDLQERLEAQAKQRYANERLKLAGNTALNSMTTAGHMMSAITNSVSVESRINTDLLHAAASNAESTKAALTHEASVTQDGAARMMGALHGLLSSTEDATAHAASFKF
ncbi:hypothetical protein D7S86_19795 [Pararobbsia silviterrae]|uniref:Uncharacterized protein n=2 Tax=Pararobbsia silviterrae TaxID=1792498 RepID=A0A494XHW9_9BURK|nr:hypothetical protein D7S86_19795 [Pararobbsia silviterrae]